MTNTTTGTKGLRDELVMLLAMERHGLTAWEEVRVSELVRSLGEDGRQILLFHEAGRKPVETAANKFACPNCAFRYVVDGSTDPRCPSCEYDPSDG
jgi:hypothetical protein